MTRNVGNIDRIARIIAGLGPQRGTFRNLGFLPGYASSSARTAAGYGTNPRGQTEAWIVTLAN